MDRRTIITKTGKGLMEATGKTTNLSRDLRNILKEIDGQVGVSSLLRRLDDLTEPKLLEILARLEREGYVREFFGQQDDGPPSRPLAQAPGPKAPSGGAADLDFTDLAAKVAAKANDGAKLSAQAQDIARQAQATRAREEAAARARAEAEARARAGSQPTSSAATLDRARREAEERARREAEERARRVEAERIRLEAEDRARTEIEERAKREIAERIRREEEEKARRESEERARRQAEEQARRELELRLRRDAEEKARGDAEERGRREADDRVRREVEARAKMEIELRARLDAEDRARREAGERAAYEKQERARREADLRRRAEEDTRRRLETDDRGQREEQERREREELERSFREQEEAARREEQRARREAEEKSRREEERIRREWEERERIESEKKAAEEAARVAEEDERASQEEEARQEKEEAAKEEEKARAKAEARAAKQARKEARAKEKAQQKERKRAEAAARTQSAAAPAVPARITRAKKRPGNLPKSLATGLLVLLVVSIAVLPFVPIDPAPYRKSAEAWLRQPVAIGSVSVSYLPWPRLKFQKVVIGKDRQVRIATIRAIPGLGSLFRDKKTLTRLDLEGLSFPRQFLAALLGGAGKGESLRVERITAKAVMLDVADLPLPALDVDARLAEDGAVRSMTLSNAEHKLAVTLTPQDGKTGIEASADEFALPIGGDLVLADFSAKGTITASELALREVEGRAFGGRVTGSARVRWSDGWSLDGGIEAHQMDAGRIAAPIIAGGTLGGKATYSMRALVPDRLFMNARMEGNFTIGKGSIHNVDMTRVLQGSGSGGGTTLFSEMSGAVSADPDRIFVHQIRMAAGLMSAGGQVEMDPQKNLSGRLQIELRATTVQARATLSVSGTLQDPQFRRGN